MKPERLACQAHVRGLPGPLPDACRRPRAAVFDTMRWLAGAAAVLTAQPLLRS